MYIVHVTQVIHTNEYKYRLVGKKIICTRHCNTSIEINTMYIYTYVAWTHWDMHSAISVRPLAGNSEHQNMRWTFMDFTEISNQRSRVNRYVRYVQCTNAMQYACVCTCTVLLKASSKVWVGVIAYKLSLSLSPSHPPPPPFSLQNINRTTSLVSLGNPLWYTASSNT